MFAIRSLDVVVAMLLAHAAGHRGWTAKPHAPAARRRAAARQQKTFATPEEAVKELIAAVEGGRREGAAADPRAGGEDASCSSGDAVADKAGPRALREVLREAHKLEKSGDAKAVLEHRQGRVAVPDPDREGCRRLALRHQGGQGGDPQPPHRPQRALRRCRPCSPTWMRSASTTCAIRRRTSCCSYAQKFASTQGKRDGLYFPTKAGEPPSPLGPLVRQRQGGGLRQGRGRQAGALPRLPLPHPEGAGAGRAGRRLRLRRAGQDDRRPRARRLAGDLRQLGRDDLHGQPRRRGVREGPRAADTAAAAAKITKFNPDKTWKQEADSAKK